MSNDTLSPGEMDWTVCPSGANCPDGMKFAMIRRGGGKGFENSCQITFSADTTTWGRYTTTDNVRERPSSWLATLFGLRELVCTC